MSVVSAFVRTGVMRPPSGIDTASATFTLSLYVMPLASGVHTAPATMTAETAARYVSLCCALHVDAASHDTCQTPEPNAQDALSGCCLG